jgi:hypothetical protein
MKVLPVKMASKVLPGTKAKQGSSERLGTKEQRDILVLQDQEAYKDQLESQEKLGFRASPVSVDLLA